MPADVFVGNAQILPRSPANVSFAFKFVFSTHLKLKIYSAAMNGERQLPNCRNGLITSTCSLRIDWKICPLANHWNLQSNFLFDISLFYEFMFFCRRRIELSRGEILAMESLLDEALLSNLPLGLLDNLLALQLSSSSLATFLIQRLQHSSGIQR